MQLRSLTRPELIFPNLPASDLLTALRAVADRLAERGVVHDADELYRRLVEREKLGSTGIGAAVAVPHCKLDGLDAVVVSVALCPRGIDFQATDGKPVKVLFTVISPSRSAAEHLQSLAAISRWVKANNHMRRILRQRTPEAIYELLGEEAGTAGDAERR